MNTGFRVLKEVVKTTVKIGATIGLYIAYREISDTVDKRIDTAFEPIKKEVN